MSFRLRASVCSVDFRRRIFDCPRDAGKMFGKIVRLNRSLLRLEARVELVAQPGYYHESLGFQQSRADACVMRLIEPGSRLPRNSSCR